MPDPRGRFHCGFPMLPPGRLPPAPRRAVRYPSDVTDAQWAELDPLLPDPACLAGRGGRWEKHCRRLIVDAIGYVVDNGIKWRALPADFPPWQTVYKRFAAWEKVGASQRLLDALRDRVRLAEGRVAAPSAAVMDSQSVRAAETVGRAARGWDGGKKVAGRKRHIVVDTPGLLVAVLVTPASTQDRVAARSLLRRLRDIAGGRVSSVWADGGCTGPLLDWARKDTSPGGGDRSTPTGAVLHRAAQKMGGGTNPGLDHRTPPLRPRLRTTPASSRGDGPLVHDPHRQPPTHPTSVARKQLLRTCTSRSIRVIILAIATQFEES